MKEVNIYIQTTFKGLKRQNGAVGYVLSTMAGEKEVTISDISKVTAMTTNGAELTTLVAAVSRLTKPCDLTIWTNSFYVKGGIEQYLKDWKENDWKNAKGLEIAYKDDWKMLEELLEPHKYRIKVGEHHEFRDWLISSCEAKKRELIGG